MRIAVLAWGSLLWDPRELALGAPFAPSGPQLPIEFCRISADGRLTLIVDESHGTSCQTYAAISAFDSLGAAMENLRLREGMSHVSSVGFVEAARGGASFRAQDRHPSALQTIRGWTNENHLDATIWTALPSNFGVSHGAHGPFSTEAAISYLEALEEEPFQRALAYIRNAPANTQTPVRHAVSRRWPVTDGEKRRPRSLRRAGQDSGAYSPTGLSRRSASASPSIAGE